MVERRPAVIIGGIVQQLPEGDTLAIDTITNLQEELDSKKSASLVVTYGLKPETNTDVLIPFTLFGDTVFPELDYNPIYGHELVIELNIGGGPYNLTWEMGYGHGFADLPSTTGSSYSMRIRLLANGWGYECVEVLTRSY